MIYTLPAELSASLHIVIDGDSLRSSSWADTPRSPLVARRPQRGTLAFEVASQLDAYCRRKLRIFDLPLLYEGTEFERVVWRTVAAIPFGARVSYADVARAAGRPGAHRGVARAMSTLAFALLVPAHRVVGADCKVKGACAASMRLRLLDFEVQADPVHPFAR